MSGHAVVCLDRMLMVLRVYRTTRRKVMLNRNANGTETISPYLEPRYRTTGAGLFCAHTYGRGM